MDELATFVEQALRISVPYALAALGGAISERAGVVALGLEGMLLGGAFTTTLAVHASGSTTLGVLAALCWALDRGRPGTLVWRVATHGRDPRGG